MASLIPIMPLMFLLFTTLYHFGEARNIAVGGSLDAWKVPESPNNTLNAWAATVRLQVGDTLLWKYDSKIDSVLQVIKENYESCNTDKPLKAYNDGNTKVILEVSGPYYFISGAPTGNCGKGEKVIIVVQSSHHQPKPGPTTTPPTPSPAPASAPAPSLEAPAPAPAKNTAVGLVVGNGIFWALTIVIGLAWA